MGSDPDLYPWREDYCEVCGGRSVLFGAVKGKPFVSCEDCGREMREILLEYDASPALREIPIREYVIPFLRFPSEKIGRWAKSLGLG